MSFDFFSDLLKKDGSGMHRKNLKGYWSLLPKVVRVRQGRRVKNVIDQEIRKEIHQ